MDPRPPLEPPASAAGPDRRLALAVWLAGVPGLGLALWLNGFDVTSPIVRLAYGGLAGLALTLAAIGPFLLVRRIRSAGTTLRAFVVFAATLYSLASLEALARAFPLVDSFSANPGSRYLWPDYYRPANTLGYKDREPGPKRGPRILVLGDSYAEGAGVPREDRFAAVLERLYREHGEGVEVFDAGHCGMDTRDEWEILERTGDRIEPDVVVVAYTVNDADGQGIRPSAAGPAWDLVVLQSLRSYVLYRIARLPLLRPPAPEDDPFLRQHRPGSPGYELALESLDHIAAWAEQRSVSAVLVALPLFAPHAERHRELLDRVVAEARERGFIAYNGLDDFTGRAAELGVSPYDWHPGREAHQMTASRLLRVIGRPWEERERRPPNFQPLPLRRSR